jgi:hypothetical protein
MLTFNKNKKILKINNKKKKKASFTLLYSDENEITLLTHCLVNDSELAISINLINIQNNHLNASSTFKKSLRPLISTCLFFLISKDQNKQKTSAFFFVINLFFKRNT